MATDEGLEQFEQLEDKIRKAVERFESAQGEKESLRKENAEVRRKLAEQEHLLRALREQLHRFEKERAGVKSRVEKVLEQVEILTQAATDSD
jgi:FtsZ-binding cell division protein ZapB